MTIRTKTDPIHTDHKYLITVMDIAKFLDDKMIDSIEQQMWFSRAYEQLPEYRTQKIDRLKGKKDKLRSMAAGVLLNQTIALYLQMHKKKIEIPEDLPAEDLPARELTSQELTSQELVYLDLQNAIEQYRAEYNYQVQLGEDEKPYFLEHPQLHFNLTHTGYYVACVMSDAECGIDMEGPRKQFLSVAKRFFAPEEFEWIQCQNEDRLKLQSFLRLWTLKEAYNKARGIGIYKGIGDSTFVPQGKEANSKMTGPDVACTMVEYSLFEYQMSVVILS